MKVNFKRFAYAFGIIGVILLSSNVYSQPAGDPPPDREAMHEKRRAQMLENFKQLDLSPVQEKQLNAHRKSHIELGKEIHENIKAKREALREELQQQELDMKKIRKIHSELKNIRSQKADHRLEGILEVRKILTTEQFTKFMELKKELHFMRKKGEKL